MIIKKDSRDASPFVTLELLQRHANSIRINFRIAETLIALIGLAGARLLIIPLFITTHETCYPVIPAQAQCCPE